MTCHASEHIIELDPDGGRTSTCWQKWFSALAVHGVCMQHRGHDSGAFYSLLNEGSPASVFLCAKGLHGILAPSDMLPDR